MIRREKFFKNCKPALITAVKKIKTINAKPSIAALKAEKDRILAELDALRGVQPAFAGNYALAA